MNRTMFNLAAATTLMAATLFTGCKSSDKKVEDAQNKVQDAKQDLTQAQKDAAADAQKAADAERWKFFKNESEMKIKDNEIRIDELKATRKKSGKKANGLYEARIDTLEQRNRDMKTRMNEYEKQNSDWESFKVAYNHDMDTLSMALKDFKVKNKK